MNMFELNKIAGAVLAAVLGVMAIREVGSIVYHVEGLERTAILIEGVEVTGAAAAALPEAAQEEVLPDFGTLLAAADIEAGKTVAARCVQCHTWDDGGANKIGPNLWDIVGAKHAHIDGFNYSAAIAGIEGPWDYAALYKFMQRPNGYAPGNKMAFAGLPRQSDRINLIAYMRTWSNDPEPLPAPAAPAEAPAGEDQAEAPAGEATPATP